MKYVYVVERSSWFNEKGIESDELFYIKYKKSFLGLFSYWKYIRHYVHYGHEDSIYTKTEFATESEANQFAKELCKGISRNERVLTSVNEVTCK
jgi:hypothetical protein|tara:strand:- start:464 stop:745 length:282 start_codon:yes stop_codon:yes gene_type:complete